MRVSSDSTDVLAETLSWALQLLYTLRTLTHARTHKNTHTHARQQEENAEHTHTQTFDQMGQLSKLHSLSKFPEVAYQYKIK